MNNFAIVIVAYNRKKTLERLIDSLLQADYQGDSVRLVVSIDNSGSREVADYAEAVHWPFGEKIVIAREARLGLKQHVLACGDLTRQYENICVLEDDLFVSPCFYVYAKKALERFSGEPSVAGISLYSHQWNPYVDSAFSAIEDQYDVFMLQIAQSWGQIWTREQWQGFRSWLVGKNDEDVASDLLPTAVSTWSSKSWLKFHNRYLVDSNKYFVYPKRALCTNFSDEGEHAISTNTYQVSLYLNKFNYSFPDNLSDLLFYDAFFENGSVCKVLDLDPDCLDVSMYGNKVFNKRYVLTTRLLNYKIIRSFGLHLRPIEMNVVFSIAGDGIYLYDRSIEENNSFDNDLDAKRVLYDAKVWSLRKLSCAVRYALKKRVIMKLKSI